MRVSASFVLGAIGLTGLWLGALAHAAQTQHQPGAHEHPEAQKLVNPQAATPESIAAGRKLYQENCIDCHGEAGKGDGEMAAEMDPKPGDFTDDQWVHGSTDGEIFVVIRDGTRTGMLRFGKTLKADDIWHLVNYVRSLGPQGAQKR